MGLVISLAGEIGSGKSSLARALADTLGWPVSGFGDYIRGELSKRGGDPNSRKGLQDLGRQLLENPEEFCLSVLKQVEFLPGGNLIVDGVRHVLIQEVLCRLVFPSTAKLIFLTANATDRLGRVSSRPDGAADFSRASDHIVEQELASTLPGIADARVDTADGFDAVTAACLALVSKWSSAALSR